MGPATSRSRRRGGAIPRPLILLLVLIVIVGGGYLLFGDEIADTVNVILYGEPAPPPVAKKSAPSARPVAPASVATTPSAGLSAVASSSQLSPVVASPVGPTSVAPSTGISTVAVSAPESPATAAPAAPPAVAVAAPAAPAPLAPKAAISPEQDLPSVLDRIRQARSKAALQPSAVVDRSPTGVAGADQAASGTAADGMVSVSQEAPRARDDAERAYDMLLHGQYEGAIDLYNSVLKTSPDYVAALLGKAIALHKLRRPQEARQLYQRVLAIDPENREALTNMTAIVAAQTPAAALRELRDLQKTYPGFSPIPAQIAEIEAQAGNVGEAISSFNRAIQLSPDNGLYRLNLAIVQDRAGMAREAAASYQAALDRFDARVQLPIPVDSIRARLRYLQSR